VNVVNPDIKTDDIYNMPRRFPHLKPYMDPRDSSDYTVFYTKDIQEGFLIR